MNPATGKIMMITGAAILLIGLLVYFLGDKLGFIGKLPGDIRVEKGNSKFYFPVTTCILVSLIGTGIIRLIQWFMNK